MLVTSLWWVFRSNNPGDAKFALGVSDIRTVFSHPKALLCSIRSSEDIYKMEFCGMLMGIRI